MERDDLRTEAILFSRYLVDAAPSEELIARYSRGVQLLFAAPPSEGDRAILDYARQHPWSIPMLDAATAFQSDSLFRKRLLVMMAILETTPELVDRTEQRSVGLGRLTMQLATSGARIAFHLATGLALTTALRGRRRVR